MALNYLLSMSPNLEAKDIKGYTPLHIAIPSVEKLGSTRSVKALLLRGADRNSLDNQGKKPFDLIPPELDSHLQNDLRSALT